MQKGYVGIVYDILDEVVIDTSPIERETQTEAMRDALSLVAYVNSHSSDYNGRTVYREDAYVKGPDGEIIY